MVKEQHRRSLSPKRTEAPKRLVPFCILTALREHADLFKRFVTFLDLPTLWSWSLVVKEYGSLRRSIADGFPEYRAMREVVARTFCLGPTRNITERESSTIDELPARACYEEELFRGGLVKATRQVFLPELCVFHGYVELALFFQKRGFFSLERAACIAAVMNQRAVFSEPRLWYNYAVGCVPYQLAADTLLCFARTEILDDGSLNEQTRRIIQREREALEWYNNQHGTANPFAPRFQA